MLFPALCEVSLIGWKALRRWLPWAPGLDDNLYLSVLQEVCFPTGEKCVWWTGDYLRSSLCQSLNCERQIFTSVADSHLSNRPICSSGSKGQMDCEGFPQSSHSFVLSLLCTVALFRYSSHLFVSVLMSFFHFQVMRSVQAFDSCYKY